MHYVLPRDNVSDSDLSDTFQHKCQYKTAVLVDGMNDGTFKITTYRQERNEINFNNGRYNNGVWEDHETTVSGNLYWKEEIYPTCASLNDAARYIHDYEQRGIDCFFYPKAINMLKKAGYFKDEKKGGCFITTTVCEQLLLPDNCNELTVMRRFRDEYLLKTQYGRNLVEEYYSISPQIAAKLSSKSDIDFAWRAIEECIHLIENGLHDDAIAKYKCMVDALRNRLT